MMAPPTTRTNGLTDAWEGTNQVGTEHSGGLDAVLMGARLYLPAYGQFVAIDPVFGGNPNPYAYPVDPINGEDLTGLKGGPAAANGEALEICKSKPDRGQCKRAVEVRTALLTPCTAVVCTIAGYIFVGGIVIGVGCLGLLGLDELGVTGVVAPIVNKYAPTAARVVVGYVAKSQEGGSKVSAVTGNKVPGLGVLSQIFENYIIPLSTRLFMRYRP